MCCGLKVRFQVSLGVVAGSHQLNIMTLKVGSFVFRLKLENTQEPMSKYLILLAVTLTHYVTDRCSLDEGGSLWRG